MQAGGVNGGASAPSALLDPGLIDALKAGPWQTQRYLVNSVQHLWWTENRPGLVVSSLPYLADHCPVGAILKYVEMLSLVSGPPLKLVDALLHAPVLERLATNEVSVHDTLAIMQLWLMRRHTSKRPVVTTGEVEDFAQGMEALLLAAQASLQFGGQGWCAMTEWQAVLEVARACFEGTLNTLHQQAVVASGLVDDASAAPDLGRWYTQRVIVLVGSLVTNLELCMANPIHEVVVSGAHAPLPGSGLGSAAGTGIGTDADADAVSFMQASERDFLSLSFLQLSTPVGNRHTGGDDGRDRDHRGVPGSGLLQPPPPDLPVPDPFGTPLQDIMRTPVSSGLHLTFSPVPFSASGMFTSSAQASPLIASLQCSRSLGFTESGLSGFHVSNGSANGGSGPGAAAAAAEPEPSPAPAPVAAPIAAVVVVVPSSVGLQLPESAEPAASAEQVNPSGPAATGDIIPPPPSSVSDKAANDDTTGQDPGWSVSQFIVLGMALPGRLLEAFVKADFPMM